MVPHVSCSFLRLTASDFYSLTTTLFPTSTYPPDFFGNVETLRKCAPSVLLGVSRTPKVDGEADPIELDHVQELLSDTSGTVHHTFM